MAPTLCKHSVRSICVEIAIHLHGNRSFALTTPFLCASVPSRAYGRMALRLAVWLVPPMELVTLIYACYAASIYDLSFLELCGKRLMYTHETVRFRFMH